MIVREDSYVHLSDRLCRFDRIAIFASKLIVARAQIKLSFVGDIRNHDALYVRKKSIVDFEFQAQDRVLFLHIYVAHAGSAV